MSDPASSASNSSGPHSAPGGLAGGGDSIGDAALQALHDRLMREKEEPTEGFSLIPIFLIFLGCALVYVNGIYIATHSGAFHSDVYNDNWSPNEGGPAVVDMMKLGARVYKDNCATCHQPDALGKDGAYPPLAGSPWPVGNPARAIKIVLAGMSGAIVVNEKSVPNGSMPNVGKTLKDLDIAAVLTYVRASFGNNDVEVDPALVTQVRADLGNRGAWTPDEILKVHPLGDYVPPPPPGAPDGTAAPAGTAAPGGTVAPAGTTAPGAASGASSATK